MSQQCTLKNIVYRLTSLYFRHFLGWNGKHCTLEGCPNSCNGHGQCKTNHALEWECWCESGWFGQGCDIPMEQDCSDRRDNDQGESIYNMFGKCMDYGDFRGVIGGHLYKVW